MVTLNKDIAAKTNYKTLQAKNSRNYGALAAIY